MQKEEAALLNAIAAQPEEYTNRGGLADWYIENGAPEHGELMHIQCGLAQGKDYWDNTKPTAERLKELRARERELLEPCRGEWVALLKDLGVTSVDIERGLPTIAALSLGSFLQHGGTLFKRMPPLTGISLRSNRIAVAGATALAESEYLTNLTTLDLGVNGIEEAGARALAGSARLKNLTTLSVGYNGIADAGAGALARSAHLAKLITLSLAHNRVIDAGARALAESECLANLTTLNMHGNGIGDTGAEALVAESSHVTNLTTLNLGHNVIGNAGAIALAKSARLKNLTALNLVDNGIIDAGLQALAGSVTFQKGMTITVDGFSGPFEDFQRWERERRLVNPNEGQGRRPS